MLRGYNLQHFEAWLKIGATRSLHPPLPLQSEFIAASIGQTTDTVLDVFISYSRTDGDIARKLNDQLQQLGKTTWFDQESIAVGEDFQQEIEKGIENCDNFLFIISPRSINSPYCADEVEHAFLLNKRFITILCEPIETSNLHPALARVQWIDFYQGDFYHYFNELVRVLDTNREHVHQHTKWYQRSLVWQESRKSKDLLLRGIELERAKAWLTQTEQGKVQPPPTSLQSEYITSSNREKKRNRFMAIGSVVSFIGVLATSLIISSTLWLRAERQATLATLRENVTRVENLLSSSNKVEGLVLALAATGKSQDKLGRAIPAVVSSLLEAIQTVRESNRLTRTGGGYASVAFSPDGKYIVSASVGNTISLWDKQGKLVSKPFTGHTAEVSSVAFSPDGQYIVSGSHDNTIRIWNRDGKSVSKPFTGHTAEVSSVAFSPDGQYIVSDSADNSIRVWNKQGNLVSKTFTGSANNSIRVRGRDGKSVSKPFTGRITHVSSVAFSSDGQYILNVSGLNVRVLDRKKNQLSQPLVGYVRDVQAAAFSPDGQYIVSGSNDGSIRVWDRESNLVSQPFSGHTSGVKSVAFSPDGQYIVSGGFDDTIRVWDTEGNQVGQPFVGHTSPVNSVAFSPDNKYIVSSSGSTIRVWDTEGNQVGQPFVGHTSAVMSVAFSPDSQYIVSGSSDGSIKVWDKKSNLVSQPFSGHTFGVNSVAFSPDGQYIVSGSFDDTVRVWDTEGNQVGQPFIGHTSPVNSVAFSPDGQYIVSGSRLNTLLNTLPDNTIRLWDTEGNQIGQPFSGHTSGVNSVAFSPDGQYIVSSSTTIRLLDTEGNQVGQPFFSRPSQFNSVAFSSDGQYIVSGSGDKTVRVWDKQGNQVGQSFVGHTGPVNSVAFSPDGQYIVSGSRDKTVRVWDKQGNQIGQPFSGHTSGVNSVAFSPDGQYIVSSSMDKTFKMWQFGWKSWLQAGCNQLKNHPVLKKPQTEEQKQALKACLKYADWSDKDI
ncbi:TIR domain-containing protein [Pleurocapsa sp. PCC 7319]|uniref:toll/interleukin-1 receptor domain-containing protein n=1 Tax=Pleurocapsa sp. PCC 7319 TaxID=118161 RepID=UPI000347E394|nr:TIR domain-containing protein [Pleurocapsa sp. PCC 7319]